LKQSSAIEYCYKKNNTEMTTPEKITEKLDEIASRAGSRRDVAQLVDALRDAVATITQFGTPPARMTPQQRSKMADDALDRVARLLGLRN
jgi:hypothetical protein